MTCACKPDLCLSKKTTTPVSIMMVQNAEFVGAEPRRLRE